MTNLQIRMPCMYFPSIIPWFNISRSKSFLSSSKFSVNLLDHIANETIWQKGFWAFRNSLMNCVTLNSPLEKLFKPNQVQVSFLIKTKLARLHFS